MQHSRLQERARGAERQRVRVPQQGGCENLSGPRPTVKNLTPGSGLSFDDADHHELKGIPDRWHLYRVVT
jgi:hypothetical protein